jgi:hypothetical protein
MYVVQFCLFPYFYNPDHVNYKEANILSKKVNEDINNISSK